jgi:hypothetical protein
MKRYVRDSPRGLEHADDPTGPFAVVTLADLFDVRIDNHVIDPSSIVVDRGRTFPMFNRFRLGGGPSE